MGFVIRAAAKADLPAIHRLVMELAEYEKEPEAVVTTVDEYAVDFENRLFEGHVAEKNGFVVGMTVFYMAYSTWRGKMLYLEDFVVAQSARGQGVGQLLFDAFLEEARQRGCRVTKWQVLDWNEPALRFYARNNAVIEKNWWNGKVYLEGG